MTAQLNNESRADAGRESYRARLMVAFHGRETDGRNPVGENAAGLALFVTGDPMAFAIAPDDEAMG